MFANELWNRFKAKRIFFYVLHQGQQHQQQQHLQYCVWHKTDENIDPCIYQHPPFYIYIYIVIKKKSKKITLKLESELESFNIFLKGQVTRKILLSQHHQLKSNTSSCIKRYSKEEVKIIPSLSFMEYTSIQVSIIGDDLLKRSSAEKDLGVLVGQQVGHEPPACCSCGHEGQWYPEMH